MQFRTASRPPSLLIVVVVFFFFCSLVRGQRDEGTESPTPSPTTTAPPPPPSPPLAAFPTTADELIRYLNNKIWVTTVEHDRLSVDKNGAVSIKTGKNVALEFVGYDDAALIKINWWNVDANISVWEYAVGTPVGGDELSYVEAAGHTDDFPGLLGGGHVKIRENDGGGDGDGGDSVPVIMEMSQVGRLVDGSASGFSTVLPPADAWPDHGVGQTYPNLDSQQDGDGGGGQGGGGSAGGPLPPSNQGNNIPFSTSSAKKIKMTSSSWLCFAAAAGTVTVVAVL